MTSESLKERLTVKNKNCCLLNRTNLLFILRPYKLQDASVTKTFVEEATIKQEILSKSNLWSRWRKRF
jgi:hypothetical protein